MDFPKVYIIVLNYNGWKDTLECLESLTRLTFPHYQVVVVDNFSNNDSLSHIRKWADGYEHVVLPTTNPLYNISHPPANKPIPYKLYSREEAEIGNHEDDLASLTLIETGANLGFAGGNNVALRHILKRGDADYVWLLNNDTVVEPDSLSHLVQCYADINSKHIGIVGGKILYYHKPYVIQCIGGAYYNKWFGYSRQIGNHQIDKGQYETQIIHPDLIIGACMLVSTHFLNVVGLLNEEYFLYFEEQDWAERAKRNNFRLHYTTKAVIYHKEGSSIGASQWKGTSRLSDFYFARSKILFTKRYFSPLTQLTVKLSFIATLLNRIRRKEFNRIGLLLKVIFNPNQIYK